MLILYYRLFSRRIVMTNNKKLLSWVDEITTLCQPDKVVWFDGSDEQQESILEDLVAHDAAIKLNQ